MEQMEEDVQVVQVKEAWTFRDYPARWKWNRDEHARTFNQHRQSFNSWYVGMANEAIEAKAAADAAADAAAAAATVRA